MVVNIDLKETKQQNKFMAFTLTILIKLIISVCFLVLDNNSSFHTEILQYCRNNDALQYLSLLTTTASQHRNTV